MLVELVGRVCECIKTLRRLDEEASEPCGVAELQLALKCCRIVRILVSDPQKERKEKRKRRGRKKEEKKKGGGEKEEIEEKKKKKKKKKRRSKVGRDRCEKEKGIRKRN